jgi:uncharacterized membrane protein
MDIVIPVAEFCANALELMGILVIALLALYSTVRALMLRSKRIERMDVFREYRREMARGILSGLEFLVAADIIRTVAIDLTFTSVGVLAIIVLIRTFLSFTLELEMTGRWPWQRSH